MGFLVPPPPLWGKKRHLAQKAKKILGAKGAKESLYKASKAPKLIYTVILWCRFVVQSPPPPMDPCDTGAYASPVSVASWPPHGGTGQTKGGGLQGGGGGGA